MTARGLGRVAARVARSVRPANVKSRAAEFARTLKAEYEAGKADAPTGDQPTDSDSDRADAHAVADALRHVDWAKVRAATGERTTEAAHAMRSMAAEVDWQKVQPVAAKVSSALIAAVASGQLGLGGRVGGTVARAIMNDRDLAQRVSATMSAQQAPEPPDFRPALGQPVIDTTATDA